MSLLLPPPPPVIVYPNTVSPSPSSHSKGSFGMVFIVLAVIVVLSAIACFLGRLCSRRSSSSKPRQESQDHTFNPKSKPRQESQDYTFHPKPKRESQDHTFQPKPKRESQDHTFHPKDGDLEFGFNKGIPTSKPAINGGRTDSIPGYSFETKDDIKAARYGAARAST
ncbi:hypothetical protein NE237_006783 [Protea cynaroides]|uniref:Transmembrane protein n=1 Tax=Protea cynaroides TaxID=273540 RepID=A0A9Q0KN92_9MAGN|nr:hypothetical protein NE237_006783 [Protea cynaroides]